jgi:hypothetical protein
MAVTSGQSTTRTMSSMVRLIGRDRQDHAMMYLGTPPRLIGTEALC